MCCSTLWPSSAVSYGWVKGNAGEWTDTFRWCMWLGFFCISLLDEAQGSFRLPSAASTWLLLRSLLLHCPWSIRCGPRLFLLLLFCWGCHLCPGFCGPLRSSYIGYPPPSLSESPLGCLTSCGWGVVEGRAVGVETAYGKGWFLILFISFLLLNFLFLTIFHFHYWFWKTCQSILFFPTFYPFTLLLTHFTPS